MSTPTFKELLEGARRAFDRIDADADSRVGRAPVASVEKALALLNGDKP